MRTSVNKPIVAITIGDFNGIGPEVVIKSVNHVDVRKVCQPLLVGPMSVITYYALRFKTRLPLIPLGEKPARLHSPLVHIANTYNREDSSLSVNPGDVSPFAGLLAAQAIEAAIQIVQEKRAHALVTAPVSKKAMHLAGVEFPGQTEMVQHLTGSKHVAMMLVSDSMRVGLATIHIPVSEIAQTLSRQLLRDKIQIVHDALKHDWKIRAPKIAVLGLNPHASEDGDIGREDLDIVAHVVKEFRIRKMCIEGPFPADSFFGRYKPGVYDAVIAMYHDQGLIPLKMSAFGKGVNISVGLNIVRTSPDHGTAFDIAGKGIADPGSMIEAIKLAALVATNRGIFRKSKRKTR